MKVKAVFERDDGGVDVMLEELTEWEVQALIQAGFVSLLEEYAEQEKKLKETPALLRK